MERTCPECGNTVRGRSDKKFCSPECRNAYHNKKNRDTNNYIRNINNILRKNRRVLARLAPSGKKKIHREKMIKEGFDFDYHTHTYTTKKSNSTYTFCYDYGYLPVSKNWYLVVKRDLDRE